MREAGTEEEVAIDIIGEGLAFPEGPVALQDGSILVAEIRGGSIARIWPDGRTECLAHCGGGPNGMALGPDGTLYVCNNGGNSYGEGHFLSIGPAADYEGGSIQRVTMDGAVSTLHTHVAGRRLSAPNDIVFDRNGGFYFTDIGKKHRNCRDHGGLYYAPPDGAAIVEVIYPMLTPNGVGLSPDGGTLYVADTETARILAFDVLAPGKLRRDAFPAPHGGRLLCAIPGHARLDSLALDRDGNIYVATLISGHITAIDPQGRIFRRIRMPDIYPTNLCFDRNEPVAYVTLSKSGALAGVHLGAMGLPLCF